ncbi:MAG: hypothetical protein Q8R36_05605 [bacterium]|nr:hypothetical protein [bacterium]
MLAPEEIKEMEGVNALISKVFDNLLASGGWEQNEELGYYFAKCLYPQTGKKYSASIMPINIKISGVVFVVLCMAIQIPVKLSGVNLEQLLILQSGCCIGRLEVTEGLDTSTLTYGIIVTKDSSAETITDQLVKSSELLMFEVAQLEEKIKTLKSVTRGRRDVNPLAITIPVGNA